MLTDLLDSPRYVKRVITRRGAGIAVALLLTVAAVAAGGYFTIVHRPADAVMSQEISAAKVMADTEVAQATRPVIGPIARNPVEDRSTPVTQQDRRPVGRTIQNPVHKGMDKGKEKDKDKDKDNVLYITNIGDQIVISHDPRNSAATAHTPAQREQGNSPALEGGVEPVTTDPVQPRAKYEDVYPGCPGVLPQGAEEQMAQQLKQLYGCQYYSTCEAATDESPASCTWYFVSKL